MVMECDKSEMSDKKWMMKIVGHSAVFPHQILRDDRVMYVIPFKVLAAMAD